MVFLSHQAALNESFIVKPCRPSAMFTGVPEVDLSDPRAKTLIVKACQHFGCFKLVNHSVPQSLVTNLQNEALKFFRLPQSKKDKTGPPDPYGYGSKRIGSNGDVGWLEYLLLNANPDVISPKSLLLLEQNSENFRLTRDERSDCCLRVNHYPACPELEEAEILSGGSLIGFGEHTDPQIISVVRANNITGLQICLQDGTWASIPPDDTSFFVIVGDLLQVMTNGRFKSVKHRVLANSSTSRLSMIYFGGPPLDEKIAPLPSLVSKEEESLYKEFTWKEYKNAAYNSRLSDNRLSLFEKSCK
ncbi:gibberellin 2-beta-dioxygenase [Cajanus cajan]|uniref:gibberellin 2-beta-dioxygenase n=1 Tax=Cajanus cajan TaxID=3821 RepID=UPI0010FBA08C|nr:gibberellin 2-beta-dioxygenase [Cajanus cajan]